MSNEANTAAKQPQTATVSEAKLWDVLTYVYDPELEVDVVNLGLVYGIAVDGTKVTLTMTLTTMGCPAQQDIEDAARIAAATVEGVTDVQVEWTFDPPWTPARVTEEGRDLLISLGYL